MDLECTLEAAASPAEVAFSFAVTNVGDDPAELTFPTAQTHDVAVRAEGEEVWRWSDGQMFAQMLGSETLAPGESASFEAVWDDPAPGSYEAVAELVANDADCEATTSVEL